MAQQAPRIRYGTPFDPWPEPGEVFVRAVEALGEIATAETCDVLVDCVRRFPTEEHRVEALATLVAVLPRATARELLTGTATASPDDFLALVNAHSDDFDEADLEFVVDVALKLQVEASAVALAFWHDRLPVSAR